MIGEKMFYTLATINKKPTWVPFEPRSINGTCHTFKKKNVKIKIDSDYLNKLIGVEFVTPDGKDLTELGKEMLKVLEYNIIMGYYHVLRHDCAYEHQ